MAPRPLGPTLPAAAYKIPGGDETIQFAVPFWTYMLYPLPGEYALVGSPTDSSMSQLWLHNRPDYTGNDVDKFQLSDGLELWCDSRTDWLGVPELIQFDRSVVSPEDVGSVLTEMFGDSEFADQLKQFMLSKTRHNIFRYPLNHAFERDGIGDSLDRFAMSRYGQDWSPDQLTRGDAERWLEVVDGDYKSLIMGEKWLAHASSRIKPSSVAAVRYERLNYLRGVREAVVRHHAHLLV